MGAIASRQRRGGRIWLGFGWLSEEGILYLKILSILINK